jgi:hypothetical protein
VLRRRLRDASPREARQGAASARARARARARPAREAADAASLLPRCCYDGRGGGGDSDS